MPAKENSQKGQACKGQQSAPATGGPGCMISTTPRQNAALHHTSLPALGAQQLLPGEFARTHLLLAARGRTPVRVYVVVRPGDVPSLPASCQQQPPATWMTAEPPAADAEPDGVMACLQRQCIANAAGSVLVGEYKSHLQPSLSTSGGSGGEQVLDCSPFAALANWQVAVVEVVAMRALALHLWRPSSKKRPRVGAGGRLAEGKLVAVKNEAPVAAATVADTTAAAAPAAPAASTDEDVPLAAKKRRRRLLQVPEAEVDPPGPETGGGSGLLGDGPGDVDQAGGLHFPGLPAVAVPPVPAPAAEAAEDSKPDLWQLTATTAAASAAAAAAAAGAAAAAEPVGARSGRGGPRPAVTRLYSGTAGAWEEALHAAVEAALGRGQDAEGGRPPPVLVAMPKGRVVQMEGRAWYFPLRYMQPRSYDSQLSVPLSLLHRLPTDAGVGVSHPITLVPLVPRLAAAELGVALEGQAVPPHVAGQLPCSADWAAVADIPTRHNASKRKGSLAGTKAGYDAFRPLVGWHMLGGCTDIPTQTVYVALLPPSTAEVGPQLKEAHALARAAGYGHLLRYPGQIHLPSGQPRKQATPRKAGAPLPTGTTSAGQPPSEGQEEDGAAAAGSGSFGGSQAPLPEAGSLGLDVAEAEVDSGQVLAEEDPASGLQQQAPRPPMFTSWRDLCLGSSGVAAWLQDFPAAMERLNSSQQQEGCQQEQQQQDEDEGEKPGQLAASGVKSSHLPGAGAAPADACSPRGSGSWAGSNHDKAQQHSRQVLYTPTRVSRGWRLPADLLRHALAQAWGGQVSVGPDKLASLPRVQVTLVVEGGQPIAAAPPLLATLLPANAAAAGGGTGAGGDVGRPPSHYWLVGEGVSRTLRDLWAYSVTGVTGVPPAAVPRSAAAWPFHTQAATDRPHLALHLSKT